MTANQEKALAAGAALGLAGLIWWLWPKGTTPFKTSAGPRVQKTLDINADVYSPDFGEPLYGPPKPVAVSPDMQRLIDASNAAIAADDADNKG